MKRPVVLLRCIALCLIAFAPSLRASSQTTTYETDRVGTPPIPTSSSEFPQSLQGPIGAVVRSYDYDAEKKVTTVHIVNTSHKEISAIDLSFQVTYPDGTLSPPGGSFYALDFLEGVIQGKGGFAPGATLDQEFPGQEGPVQATVDMVAYVDGTADVLNERVFKQLVANRKASVRAMQKINELINSALADPAEQHPTAKVIAELKRLLVEMESDEGAARYGSELKGAIQDLTNLSASPYLAQQGFEGKHLRILIKTYEDRISGTLSHIELVKAG